MSNKQIAEPKKDKVKDLITQNLQSFKDALPQGIKLDTFARIVMTAIRVKPELMEGDRGSLIAALMQSAQLGLVPDGFMGQAYLIKYGKEIQLQPGYRGLLTLARRSGEILSVTARDVYENDHFVYEDGLIEKLEFRPAEGERGELKAAYCITRFKGGGHHIEVMWRRDLDKVRAASKCPNSPAYINWPGEMAKKAVVKRASKYMPSSLDLIEAVAIDNQAEFVDPGEVIEIPEEDFTVNSATIEPDEVLPPEKEEKKAAKPESKAEKEEAVFKCRVCKEIIEGEAKVAGKAHFHPTCYDSLKKETEKPAATEKKAEEKTTGNKPGKLISCSNPECQKPLILASGEIVTGYHKDKDVYLCATCYEENEEGI